jgi:CheY-like chemotaxis protein
MPPDTLTSTPTSVLLVDDTPANLFALSAVLKSLGARLVEARSGHEAVELVAREPFAVVLMDVQMPGMDGYLATQEIRQRENGGRRTPIIAMTATVSGEERARCLAAGMDDYLAKPMRRADLAAVLSTWVTLP